MSDTQNRDEQITGKLEVFRPSFFDPVFIAKDAAP
jgi:hypothetical protein